MYSNLNDYNDPIKPYILDALEKRRLLELEMRKDIHTAFEGFISPIVSYLAFQKGEFKGIDANLEKLIEKSKEELNAKLNYIIYETLRRGASIALSVSGRLKIDEAIFNSSHNKPVATGEARGSSSNTQDVNILIKKTQLDISKKSGELAKHRMEKQRLYREKEFKLSDRVWDLSKGAGEGIKALVEAGVNMDCKKLAKAIDEYTGKGNKKTIKEYPNMMKRLKGRFPPDTTFASMRVARNELSELYFTTSIKDYLENPYIEAVQWLLANNRLKMYEEECDCSDIAYEDVYGLGRGIYPIDKVPDHPHVMCMCNIAPITRRKLKKQLEGGMKLGNVPPEDWFEKQNHEDNIELIKSKYTETGLKLFHNERGRALGLASIEIIKGHEWFNKGVHEEDKRAFLDDLHKVNGRYLYCLARYTDNMQVEFYYDGKIGSHYNHSTNKVYCNLIKNSFKPDNKALGFNLGMTTFLHEAGHWLDSNRFNEISGLTKKMPYLSAYIAKDVLNYINKTGYSVMGSGYAPINRISQLSQEVKNEVNKSLELNKAINSNISDLYGAMTANKINTGFRHKIGYWNYDKPSVFIYRLTSEAVAEMFESLGHPERIKAMREFLPNAWGYFNMILNEVF